MLPATFTTVPLPYVDMEYGRSCMLDHVGHGTRTLLAHVGIIGFQYSGESFMAGQRMINAVKSAATRAEAWAWWHSSLAHGEAVIAIPMTILDA